MDVPTYMQGVGQQARAASRLIAKAGTATKNLALTTTAQAILRAEKSLLDANALDVAEARHKKLDDAAIDRLILTPTTIAAMADGLVQIAKLPDPVGEIIGLKYRPSGIQVGQMRDENRRNHKCCFLLRQLRAKEQPTHTKHKRQQR